MQVILPRGGATPPVVFRAFSPDGVGGEQCRSPHPPRSAALAPANDVRGVTRRRPDAAGGGRSFAVRVIDYDGLAESLRAEWDPARCRSPPGDFNAWGWNCSTCSGPKARRPTPPVPPSRTSWGGPARTSGDDRECAGSGARRTCRRSAVELWAGRLRPREALRTFARDPDVEAVFSREDPGPGLAEVALLPYLMRKRGF